MDYKRDLYKSHGGVSLADSRAARAERLTAFRQTNRFNILNERRGAILVENEKIPKKNVETATEEPPVKLGRAEKLKLWKAEKERRMAKMSQKPAFRVGVVQCRATGSPLCNVSNTYASKNFLKPSQIQKSVKKPNVAAETGVITRARKRQMENDCARETQFLRITSQRKVPIKAHPFVVPQAVSKLAQNLKITLPQSPQITKSARKSVMKKMTLEEQIEKEEEEFSCRIFSHKKYVQCETSRLLEKCDEWSAFCRKAGELPSDIEGEINAVVGKTKLLTSDKFKQYKELIEKCEKKDPMIKIDDLQGFQDWVALEVESVDTTFIKLAEMRATGFKRQVDEAKEGMVTKPAKSTKPVNPKAAPKGSSNMRAYILAGRKRMQQTAKPDFQDLLQLDSASPKQTSTPKRKEGPLRKVVSSEKKRRVSGLEMIAATHLAKALTPQGKGLAVKGLSEKYFTSPQGDSEDSEDSMGENDILGIMMRRGSSNTPTLTPLRRSARLAKRS